MSIHVTFMHAFLCTLRALGYTIYELSIKGGNLSFGEEFIFIICSIWSCFMGNLAPRALKVYVFCTLIRLFMSAARHGEAGFSRAILLSINHPGVFTVQCTLYKRLY